MVHIHAEGPAFFCWIPKLFGKRVICTIHGLDWDREKWRGSVASKFIRGGEKNAVKYADEIIVLSKDVQKYFLETYGRETHFIPNGVNRPEVREAKLITDHFGLEKDSYILFLGRLVPEKGIRYLVEAFKNVKTDKKLVIAGGSSDTDSFMEELKELSSIHLAFRHLIDFLTVQHQVGCKSIRLIKTDLLICNRQRFIQRVQVHKNLMLQIMPQSVPADHLLCLRIKMTVDKYQAANKIRGLILIRCGNAPILWPRV